MSDETERVAAGLGAIILADADAAGAVVGVEREVAESAAEAVAFARQPSSPSPAAAAAPAPVPDPAAPEPASEQDPSALLDFTPQPDDELDALLAEAAIDDEVDAEVAAEEAEYGESYDPDEARRLKTLEKRNAHLEKELVRASKGKWVAENLRKYPLLETYFADEVKGIEATSRRGFAREAQRMNDTYAKALAKPLADIDALRAGTATVARAEARAEAAQQWGAPTTDPAGSVAAETAAAVDAELQAARARNASLHERLAIMAKGKPIF
jgi:hypothetical protein